MNSRLFPSLWLLGIACVSLASCSSTVSYSDVAASSGLAFARTSESGKDASPVDDGRIRIYKTMQTVEVAEVDLATQQVSQLVEARKGYIESSRESEDDSASASFTIRVSTDHLDSLLDEFAALGKQTHRCMTAEDTTDSYHDLQAKIRNTEALRDRLRGLLDSAEEVEEILKIEKELARVQASLDSMKGQFQRLDSQVRLATIDLNLRTRSIPGPVGAANKGFWWGIKKLFVLN